MVSVFNLKFYICRSMVINQRLTTVYIYFGLSALSVVSVSLCYVCLLTIINDCFNDGLCPRANKWVSVYYGDPNKNQLSFFIYCV